jgi:Kyakuja-Dileera-Zisupton transposase
LAKTKPKLNLGIHIHDPALSDCPLHTLFVSPEECEAMKCYIEGKRNSKVPNIDHENGVAVMNKVSDLCSESLNVANEAWSKSKKLKFNDTRLVVAVCHHDHIWYLVNMMEAGEKQYYMFTILDKIFQEILVNFTVGFLHDLACQYHRSMMKVQCHVFLFGVN